MIDPNTILGCAYWYDPDRCGVIDCCCREWCENRKEPKEET